MDVGEFKTPEEAAKALMRVTGGFPHALGSLLELASLRGMNLSKAIKFVEDRGLPKERKEIDSWWQENADSIRGQIQMKGGEFES